MFPMWKVDVWVYFWQSPGKATMLGKETWSVSRIPGSQASGLDGIQNQCAVCVCVCVCVYINLALVPLKHGIPLWADPCEGFFPALSGCSWF